MPRCDATRRQRYYSTFPVQEQARRGTWEYFLYPVYSIALLNFRLDDGTTDPDDIISVGKITNINTGRIMYDKLTYVFIEMPKFTKDLDTLTAHVEKWLYIMNDQLQYRRCPWGSGRMCSWNFSTKLRSRS